MLRGRGAAAAYWASRAGKKAEMTERNERGGGALVGLLPTTTRLHACTVLCFFSGHSSSPLPVRAARKRRREGGAKTSRHPAEEEGWKWRRGGVCSKWACV
ncbi:hypothetical protein ABW21_db0204957 [Orbilia brochopaga]|nr:hypothetical protein ABW21_db0204957 [Drechslerella brochopaga]